MRNGEKVKCGFWWMDLDPQKIILVMIITCAE